MKHEEILEKLKQSVQAGLNVLLEGLHGTGKSSLVLQAAQDLGLTLKYYSASTLDPFVDLVGLPVPITDERGIRTLEYHRPADLSQAELVFFDEFNRAHPKTLNAVMEMIQFRSINGEPLPRLKAVLAAINPSNNKYDVTDLDPALIDRFHIHISMDTKPNKAWFEQRFGYKIGLALYDWWTTDLDVKQQALISARKLEHIGILLKSNLDPALAVPHNSIIHFFSLENRLKNAEEVLDIADFVKNPARFVSEIGSDMNLATRFAHLLTRMKPMQMNAVRDLTLALPAELLSMLQKECPFVLKKTYEAICKHSGVDEAKAFKDLLEEKIAVVKPGEEDHAKAAPAA